MESIHGLLQHQCYLSGFNRVLELYHPLAPAIMDILCLTPFYHFFDEICDFTVNYYHLDDLVGGYRGDYLFQLKDKKLQLTTHDAGNILGILDTGRKIDVSKKGKACFSNPFWHCFFKTAKIPCKEVKTIVKKTMEDPGNSVDPTDIARLWLCLIFSTFLLPTTKMAMRAHLLKYIENLQAITRLNWADLVHSMIFENIETCHPNGYFYGCVAVFNLFLCQRTPLFCPNTPCASYVY